MALGNRKGSSMVWRSSFLEFDVDRIFRPLSKGSVEQVLECLDETKEERYDVIVAADCCYMPWWHSELLDSIKMLLSDDGVALVPFALHGNTDDDDVWKIVDRAKDKGLCVEVLEPRQLTPPSKGMESKQGLVHTVRLSKPMQNG